MITSLGEEEAGRCAGNLLVFPHFIVSCFSTLPLSAGGGLGSLIVSLPVDLLIGIARQKQQNDMCSQRRLSSAWASTQSDQSSLCAQWVAKDPCSCGQRCGFPG